MVTWQTVDDATDIEWLLPKPVTRLLDRAWEWFAGKTSPLADALDVEDAS